MKTKTSLLLLFLLIEFSCQTRTQPYTQISNSTPEPVSNPYIEKYSGGYTVEVKGINSTAIDDYAEVYILGPKGQAKWMMVQNERDGSATIKQQQTGRWSATETKISITASVEGTEAMTEDFNLMNGTFINTQTDTNIPLSKRHYGYLKLMVSSK